jgi:uncharacterized oxidoreductase
MAELMAGTLSGTGLSSDPAYNNGNGTMLLAIDVERFLPASEYMEQVDALEGRLHAAPAAAGFDAIQLPGEPEWRSRAERSAKGIPIPGAAIRAINDLCQELGLSQI